MLFNWFKKKDKLIPLEPAGTADSGQPAGEKAKPGKHFTPGAQGKHFGRPGVSPKAVPAKKDAPRINTSESTVIRIGKLGEVLLQYSMISRENLEKALALQQQSFIPSGPQEKAVQKRKLLGEILIENNFVTEEQLLSAFARHCRIPYIKLNKYGLPKEAIKSVPEDLILKHKVMPVDKIGSMLMLAVTDPYDTNAVEEVKARTGLKVKSILCKQSEFAEMVKFYYPHITEPQPLQDKLRPDNFGDEKPGGTPADIASEVTPKDAAPDVPAKQAPAQGTERLGEETAVFKIEELPFPEPPVSQAAPADQPAPAPQVAPPLASKPEDKKESFLGGAIEDHSSDREHPLERSETAPAKPEAKTEPVPEVSSQPLQAQESGSPAQQPPETSEVNGYDTSLIDIQDLVTAQKITSDENIEIITEEPESFAPQDKPIDVAPYIYPDSNVPAGFSSVEVPINKSFVEKAEKPKEIPEPSPQIPPEITQPARTERSKAEREHRSNRDSEPERLLERPVSPQGIGAPVSTPSPETGKESFKENPVLVSDDEFLVARQLFATQLSSSWEKLYHRSKPSHAEKVDENEFVFHTESAIR